jgi:hypothetical protein
VASSALGGMHVAGDQPNQDSVGVSVPAAPEGSVVLVVADGHGSESSFRSDRGSRLAVDVAAAVTADLLARLDRSRGAGPGPEDRTAVRAAGAEIIARWTAAVRADERDDPLPASAFRPGGPDNPDNPAVVEPGRSRDAVVLKAYGSTLLVAGLTPAVAVFLQIGDGDLVVLGADGTAGHAVAADDRLVANETASLCTATAERDVRSALVDLTERPLALVLLATDGYGNAFEDEDWQRGVVTDFHDLARRRGAAYVAGNLPGWLDESARTAGDDVTVAVAFGPLPRPTEAAEDAKPAGTGTVKPVAPEADLTARSAGDPDTTLVDPPTAAGTTVTAPSAPSASAPAGTPPRRWARTLGVAAVVAGIVVLAAALVVRTRSGPDAPGVMAPTATTAAVSSTLPPTTAAPSLGDRLRRAIVAVERAGGPTGPGVALTSGRIVTRSGAGDRPGPFAGRVTPPGDTAKPATVVSVGSDLTVLEIGGDGAGEAATTTAQLAAAGTELGDGRRLPAGSAVRVLGFVPGGARPVESQATVEGSELRYLAAPPELDDGFGVVATEAGVVVGLTTGGSGERAPFVPLGPAAAADADTCAPTGGARGTGGCRR